MITAADDFKAMPSLDKMMVLELARCDWIDRRENVIALGPSGTGKTYVALGLGLAVCQKGMPPLGRFGVAKSPVGQWSASLPQPLSCMN